MTNRALSQLTAFAVALIATSCGDDPLNVPDPHANSWFDLPAAVMQATLTGRVRVGATPLPFASLHASRLFPDGARDFRTDGNGVFAIANFPEGDYDIFLWLTFSSDLYVASPLDALVDGAAQIGESPDSVFRVKTRALPTSTGANGHAEYHFDIDLGAYSTVSGYVRDLDGVPVAGVAVVLTPDDKTALPREVVSATDGSYSFAKLKAGSLSLELSLTAQQTYRHLNRTELASLALDQGVALHKDLRVSASGTVEGFVVQPDLTAIPGASITVDGDPATTTSDSRGFYRLPAIVGDRTVTITPPPGYALPPGASAEVVVRVSQGQGTESNRTLVRTGSAAISGRVVTETGVGVPGALIATGTGATAMTSASGLYSLLDVPPGPVTLTLSLPFGYENLPNQGATRQVTAVAGQTATVPDWVVRVVPSGTIVARVRNSGEAYAGALVRLDGGDRLGTTAADGTVTFAIVPAGSHQLTLSVPPLFALDVGESNPASATVVAGQSTTVTWNLVNVGSGLSYITGTVRDLLAQGVGGVTLTLSNGSTATTTANGTYAFSSVPVGVYTITITVPPPYALAPGQAATVRVVVSPVAPTVNWTLVRP